MLNEVHFTLPHIRLAALSNRTKIHANKPTLIFLHGYLDNAASFCELLPALNDWQCIAVDMAGHGHSEHRSEGAHYHLADYAYDLHQLIETLKLQQVILVGHSLGAIVCSLYASTQATELKGFIAIESCGPLSASEETTSLQLRDCFTSRSKSQSPIKHPKDMDSIVKARRLISDLNTTQASTILSRNIQTDENGVLTWLTDKRLRTASPFRMTESQAVNVLQNITCPRILILGNQGFEKVKVNIEQRKGAFDEVPIFTFEGGHHVHMSSHSEVSECILKHVNTFISA
jgi:pimeloyl-ACP methyl ester carboxylesterase